MVYPGIEKITAVFTVLLMIILSGDPVPAQEASKTDSTQEVVITHAWWIPQKDRQNRFIVKARSDAPAGSARLTAELIRDGEVVKSDEMVYRSETKDYLSVFFHVWRKPEEVRVFSSSGASDRVVPNYSKD